MNFRGPLCLCCEKKKDAALPTTLGERSGYICEECYNANIWATKKQEFYPYSLLKVHSERNEESQD